MQNKENYPENWHDTIRPAILRRDGYKCRQCGVKHRQYQVKYDLTNWQNVNSGEAVEAAFEGYKARRVFLQVAHLDQDPSNNDEKNLEAKCPDCHRTFDKRFNLLKRIGKLVQSRRSSGLS